MKLGYRPALDGLRGLAIILVLASHAFPFLRGGFIGVDIFFVLSGFLITALLIEENELHGRIGLKNFYARRVLRLYPALLAAVAVASAVAIYAGLGGKDVLKDGLYAVSYLTNPARTLRWSPMLFLAHTWSLAVEEQFYLLWPAALILMLRLRPRKLPIAATCAFAAAFALYRALTVFAWWPQFRIGLESRGDTLLVGCALALAMSLRPKHAEKRRIPFMATAAALAAFAFLLGMAHYAGDKGPLVRVLGLPLVSLSTMVIILNLVDGGALARVFENRFLAFTGKISYGIYLYHYPVFIYFRRALHWHPQNTFFVGGSIAFAMAFLSYFLLEKPFLRLKSRFRTARSRDNVVQPVELRVDAYSDNV